MKNIKLKFVGFWDSLKPEDTLTVKLLKKHFNVEISEDPDYVFFTGYFDYKQFKYKDAVKIYFTGENVVPDFNICDYALSFEYMEYGDRAFRLPLYMLYKDDLEKCNNKHLIYDELYNKKTDFCSFVYSNNKANPIRDELFDKISTYKKVNSGGKWMNNIGEPHGVKNKYKFQLSHKFSIACENSAHPGYCTEKIVQAFAAGTVPIYWGDPKIKDVFNEKSFINVSDYKDLDNLLEKIEQVDKNNDLYLEMLKEPAFKDKHYIESTINDYEEFLVNIFSQEKKDAFRRNMFFHGAMYQKFSRIFAKMVDALSKIR